MKNLFLLFILISFSMSMFATGMGFVLYRQYRKRVLLYFIFFVVGLSLDVLSFGVHRLPGLDLFHNIINLLASSFLTLGIPLFFLTLIGIELKRLPILLLLIVFLIQNILSLIYFIEGPELIDRVFIKIPLFVNLVSTFIIAVFQYKNIGNQFLKRAILSILVVITLQLPVLIVNEFYLIDMNVHRWIPFILSPLLNIILNVFIIYFTYRFFNQPALFRNEKVTKHLIDKYNISKREEEILNLLISGKGRDEIGAVLFISPNTVNNHIYNIYKKLRIKNKIQLLNLIKTN